MNPPAALHCVECGAEIVDSANQGCCPSCLLRLALETDLGPATDSLPRRFGPYELLEMVGQGGFGVVYRARQMELNRVVAVKVLRTGAFSTPAELRRFRAEAQAVAQLSHPNVIMIHEVGQVDDTPFFSMEFLPGPSLSTLLREGPFSPDRAATYLRAAADGIHYAHSRGLIHRDLKPANILLDSVGQPRVTDFGLVHSRDAPHELTHSGDFVGTLLYASPEQARGRHRDVGPASDVWALGATLYELLTGRAPFRGETAAEVQNQILTEEPPKLRQIRPDIPKDLERVVLKCLAKEPVRRYTGADQLAAELGRFLRREPVRAQPVGVLGKFVRWCRRKPSVAASVIALFLVMILATIAAALFREDSISSMRYGAKLAAVAIRADLDPLGRMVDTAASQTRFRDLLQTRNQTDLDRWLAGAAASPLNRSTTWLNTENWYVLGPDGAMLAHWPTGSRLTNAAFRDYFVGVAKQSATGSDVYFSRVYQGANSGLYKFGVSRAVREESGRLLGALVATVSTSTTDKDPHLRGGDRKIVLAAAGDTNRPLENLAFVSNNPPYVILLHPSFAEGERVVPTSHVAVRTLLTTTDNDEALTDAFYHDPVARRHPLYRGRWLAGFAKVPDTPFVVIYQTRDWIGDVMVVAFWVVAGTGVLVVIAANWWRRRQLLQSLKLPVGRI